MQIIPELAECSWGEREGEVKGVWFEKWKRGLELPAGAETYDEFLDRALGVINKALLNPGPVLIFALGGVYWAAQTHGTRETDEALPNATIVKHKPPSQQHPWWSTSKL